MKELKDRLKLARANKNLTQEQLGKAIGKSQELIGAIESGRNKGTKSIGSLAAVLGVSAVWLETGKGDMYLDIFRQT